MVKAIDELRKNVGMKRTPESMYWECYSNHIRIDYQIWTYFYWRLIKQYVGNPITTSGYNILDFGCGTGLSTLFWKIFPRVNRVVGLDNDRTELAIARFRGIKTFPSFSTLRLYLKRFQAIVAYNDAINHISPDHLQKTFIKPVFQLLQKNGAVVFDVLTPEKHKVATINPVKFSGWEVRQRALPLNKDFLSIEVTFMYKQHLVKTIVEYLFSQEFIKTQFFEAGFNNVYFHHLFKEKPLKTTNSTATRLVCVATK